MSLVVSILFVLGLFALVGFAAWVAVMYALTNPRTVASRQLLINASPDESREPQYAV